MQISLLLFMMFSTTSIFLLNTYYTPTYYTIDDLFYFNTNNNITLHRVEIDRGTLISRSYIKYHYPDSRIRSECYFKTLKNTPICRYIDNDDKIFNVILTSLDDSTLSKFKLINDKVDIVVFDSIIDKYSYTNIFYYLIFFIIIKIIIFYIIGDNKGFLSIGKTKHHFVLVEKELTKMDDVSGCYEIKKEVCKYIDIIKNRKKYLDMGAQLPRGIMFAGPSGTGKTLLAKAIAGESEVRFIRCSGSDFNDKYVGVGSDRIRKLFRMAKKVQPCIIFIDEIDSIGISRDSSLRVTNHEETVTLNKFLSELDGFDKDMNVMVIGATNRYNVLDKALMRSGRFDQSIFFDLPNKLERIDIFEQYLTGSDIETKNLNEMILNLSKKTAGASCADISNICNQTKIICVQSNRQIINETDINIALEQILIGFEKPSRSMNNDEKKRVSVHEAGHALIAYILKSSNHPIKISIIPRGENALGYTQQEPDDLKLWTFDKIIAEVAVLMGGRASEEIMLNSLSSGSSDDLDKINRLMKNLFYRFGGYKNASDFMIIDKDTSSTRLYEQEEEIKKHNMIIYKKVLELISNNKESIDKLSDYLLEYETMDSTIIDNMLDNSIKNTITIEID